MFNSSEEKGDGSESTRAGCPRGWIQAVAELCRGAKDAGAGLLAHADLLRSAVQDDAGRPDGYSGGLGDLACRNALHAGILA